MINSANWERMGGGIGGNGRGVGLFQSRIWLNFDQYSIILATNNPYPIADYSQVQNKLEGRDVYFFVIFAHTHPNSLL